MTSPSDLLLNTLVKSSKPLGVTELKRTARLGVEKKELNRLLYGLEERGLVQRTVENPPLWSATTASTIILENNNDDDGSDEKAEGTIITSEEQKLIGFLMEQGEEQQRGMRVGSIAKFLGKSVAASNKILYGLERNTAIVRRSKSNPPVWKIIKASQENHDSVVYKGFSSSSNNTISSSSSDPRKEYNGILIEKDKAPKQTLQRPFQRPEEPKDARCRPCSTGANVATQKTAVAHSLSNDRKLQIREDLSRYHDPRALEKDASWARICSDAVWMKYRSLNPNAKNTDIVAGFVVQEYKSTVASVANSRIRVVAIGSGSKCVIGDQLSYDGLVVHDSHAEVVARRSFIRWLYYQLGRAGQKNSLAVLNGNREGGKPFRFAPFDLWFYTSQTPCGDSAVYTRGSIQTNEAPCWQGNNIGCFRVKMEAGQGTTFAPKNMMQSKDGLVLGDRVMHNSCSDKMAKWSVLGVQGALLSRLIDPIYINGVVVGDVFSHGHVCRALCCRSHCALIASNAALQPPFRLRHPQIRHAQLKMSRSERIKKRGKLSMNWAELDLISVEIVNGTTGRLENGTESRICKKQLFFSFSQLHKHASLKSYSENKALAVPYQTTKNTWKESMRLLFGSWTDKPREVDHFSLR
mmetsp:Transcript_3053/g.6994  ORF Transcript_3053/g.6994 Transcript_3053/m.6994 type:complete len:636 (-) Transcript_3053:216-2123(-)